MYFVNAISVFIFLLFASLPVVSQSAADNTKPEFNAPLAKKLGADEYGMKSYVMAFLKTGTVKPKDDAEQKRLMAGHLANIGRLAAEGKLVLAGPFVDGGEYRGIFVFDAATIEEAQTLTLSDPAVKAGVFKVEFIKWYGTAALAEIARIHETIAEKRF